MLLEELPPELVEEIVTRLPVAATCALRLASRTMVSKATQHHVKDKFRSKTVEVSREGLDRFVKAAESGGLCHLLQHLTLVARAYCHSMIDDEEDDGVAYELRPASDRDDDNQLKLVEVRLTKQNVESRGDAREVLSCREGDDCELYEDGLASRQLRKAFNSFTLAGTALCSIKAEVAIYQQDMLTPTPPLFGGASISGEIAAGRLIDHLLWALGNSKVGLRELNLLNSSSMVGCCPTIDALDRFDFSASQLVLPQLMSLSLCISQRPGTYEYHGTRSYDVSYHSLAKLLQSCPNLEALDLAGFSFVCADDPSFHAVIRRPSERILRALRENYLPKLHTLKLHGLHVAHASLIGVLEVFPSLRCLSLRAIHLNDGSFGTILDHCTQKLELETIHLDSLFHKCVPSGHVLHFEAPVAVDPTSDGHPCLRAHWRRGTSGHQVEHRVWQSGIVWDTKSRNWMQDLKNWYGPVQRGHWSARHMLKAEELWRHPDIKDAVWEDAQ